MWTTVFLKQEIAVLTFRSFVSQLITSTITMGASEADVLINAVKTFVLFSPENEHVISPEGAK